MSLATELDVLSKWIQRLPHIGKETLGGAGTPMLVLDFVMIGAIKRSLSMASGLHSMVQARNIVCARAILRMQLDTVTRLLAYSYVKDPERVASAVIGGTPLKKFKSTEGKPLIDAYLVDRMSRDHPWVRMVFVVVNPIRTLCQGHSHIPSGSDTPAWNATVRRRSISCIPACPGWRPRGCDTPGRQSILPCSF
jgi:hypothetical protein